MSRGISTVDRYADQRLHEELETKYYMLGDPGAESEPSLFRR